MPGKKRVKGAFSAGESNWCLIGRSPEEAVFISPNDYRSLESPKTEHWLSEWLILFIKGVCACVCFRNNETETHQVIKQLVYLGQRQSWDLNYSCLATGLQLFLPALGRSYPARAEQRKSPPTGQRPPANLKLILPSLRLRTLYRILFFFFLA